MKLPWNRRDPTLLDALAAAKIRLPILMRLAVHYEREDLVSLCRDAGVAWRVIADLGPETLAALEVQLNGLRSTGRLDSFLQKPEQKAAARNAMADIRKLDRIFRKQRQLIESWGLEVP